MTHADLVRIAVKFRPAVIVSVIFILSALAGLAGWAAGGSRAYQGQFVGVYELPAYPGDPGLIESAGDRTWRYDWCAIVQHDGRVLMDCRRDKTEVLRK